MCAAGRFDRDTALTRTGVDRFEGRIDRGWWIVRGPNGGYVAAILMRAFAMTVEDPARSARSLTVHFAAPPEEGPVRVATAVERRGRSLTAVSGRLWQGERLCAVGLAAFSGPRPGPEFQDVRMPHVPDPAEAEPLEREIAGAGSIPIHERYEQRSVTRHLERSPAGEAVAGGWVRLTEPRLADALLVTALADCWPPALWQRRGPEGPQPIQGVPTVDLTVHFRATLPLPEARPDDFSLVVFRTHVAREGFLEEDGEVWSPNGVLLAQSRQLGIVL